MKTEIITNENKTIYRLSRWIRIQRNYNPNKRNRLYYYAMDGNGYREGQNGFDPKNGLYIDFFHWNGRTYAIEQFIMLGSIWCPYTCTFNDKDGKMHYLSGYDSENYFDPILIELDEYGEYVRVYTEK